MLIYLLELRKRLIKILMYFFGLFLFLFYFSNQAFQVVVAPLLKVLPETDFLIATQVTAPVLTPINLAANLAMLLTAPFILYQLWHFIAPALYRQERYFLKGTLLSSLFLFCLGLLFCFYIVLPFIFQFFISAMPHGVRMMPDINHTLDFIIRMLLLFGFCFQVPLVCLFLVHMQWMALDSLKKSRPYVIVLAFIVGMLLTPPDVFSQILLAVPLCLLYELGIFLCFWYEKKREKLPLC